MSSPISWYYTSHNEGVFPHQKTLCDAVRWTPCNLEGQKLKSSTVLSAIQGNPLTIRLLALDEALKHFDNIKSITKEIEEIYNQQLSSEKMTTMSGNWQAENSALNTQGAPVEIITIMNKSFEIKHIDIQLALYGFFSNFGSIIDRFTSEIDKLFNLNIPLNIIYWGTITNQNGEYYKTLNEKNEDLANLLMQFDERFKIALRYRNRLIHDGIIKVEINHEFGRLNILLAENPNEENSTMNVNAIELCEKTRSELLKLLNIGYQIIIEHFGTHGKPPW